MGGWVTKPRALVAHTPAQSRVCDGPASDNGLGVCVCVSWTLVGAHTDVVLFHHHEYASTLTIKVLAMSPLAFRTMHGVPACVGDAAYIRLP